jgi:hypothetical protein
MRLSGVAAQSEVRVNCVSCDSLANSLKESETVRARIQPWLFKCHDEAIARDDNGA